MDLESFMKNITIRDVMTNAPHTVGAEQSVAVAQNMMQELGIRHLPVKKAGHLIGILSQRDIDFILRTEKSSPEQIRVEDACTPDIYAASPNQSVKEVAAIMAKDRLGCALVQNNGELLGIFTTVDACRVLSDVL